MQRQVLSTVLIAGALLVSSSGEARAQEPHPDAQCWGACEMSCYVSFGVYGHLYTYDGEDTHWGLDDHVCGGEEACSSGGHYPCGLENEDEDGEESVASADLELLRTHLDLDGTELVGLLSRNPEKLWLNVAREAIQVVGCTEEMLVSGHYPLSREQFGQMVAILEGAEFNVQIVEGE